MLCFLVAGLTCFGVGQRPPAQKEGELVYRVDNVDVRVMESYPEQLHITAEGITRTGGWSNAQLRPRPSSSEGVYEFRFEARPPAGVATQALTPITATTTMTKPKSFRWVRVIAETNAKESR